MLAVKYQKRETSKTFAVAETLSALRAELASQEFKTNAELAANKRVKIYVVGRASALADKARVGDRFDDCWIVIGIAADPKGRILVTTQET